ncbi:iron-containing alcohol dehydrogenase [Natronobiforma cellulositropha]|uniref:iron-containing alcohol dehydrogenase n=1 Tax=Natronobiforma cellulositropha TaxID=1679076 RepID=UPI0021D6154F|nr:iron-containing alcohol dehydrogenase [Natronobiforma cellulositropha]
MFDGIGSMADGYRVQSPNDIRYGAGVTAELEGYLTDRGVDSALVVTDGDILEAGAAEPVFDALEAAGVAVSTFDGVAPEPKLGMAERAAGELERADADVVVGVGGGSSLDTAKLAAVLPEYDVDVRDLLGMGNVPGRGRPTVLVPTTAGTGSEVTHIGVFADEDDENNKKVVYSEHLFCDLALVDPDLTRSLPPGVAAATGMDALSHAIEAYVSTLRTPYTDMLARRAIELVGESLREAVHQGEHNDEARYRMSLAATLGGQAFVNAGLGAVHALTYPLGVEYGIGHGRANAVLLPHVVRYNAPAEPDRLADVASLLGVDRRDGETALEHARRGADAIAALNDDIGIPNRMHELGDVRGTTAEFEAFADVAFEHSLHNIERNPRRLERADVVRIFENAY